MVVGARREGTPMGMEEAVVEGDGAGLLSRATASERVLLQGPGQGSGARGSA